MPADILQIRDFQRPKERLACDQRLGDGVALGVCGPCETMTLTASDMPTICITEDGVETLAKYSAMRDELTQAIADHVEVPSDYTPPRSRT